MTNPAIDMSRAPVSAAAIAASRRDGNCPTCQLSGVTPDRAAVIAPRWYAALSAADFSELDPYTPDEPAVCCWDCRRMLAVGLDPAGES